MQSQETTVSAEEGSSRIHGYHSSSDEEVTMKQVLPRAKRSSCSEIKRVMSCCCDKETLSNEPGSSAPNEKNVEEHGIRCNTDHSTNELKSSAIPSLSTGQSDADKRVFNENVRRLAYIMEHVSFKS